MRLWSIHPKYLDTKGLVALWRETLLAKKVLENKTSGYKNHPQLNRFKSAEDPISSINFYLSEVYHEALLRNYNFNKDKINWDFKFSTILVTRGQMEYETLHLLKKLKIRDFKKYLVVSSTEIIKPHSIFSLIEGPVEKWEIL